MYFHIKVVHVVDHSKSDLSPATSATAASSKEVNLKLSAAITSDTIPISDQRSLPSKYRITASPLPSLHVWI